MLSTIRRINHNIRTAFGDSSSTYSSLPDSIPLQGIGQGNGSGPEIWTVISSPILDSVRNSGLGIEIKSAISQSHTSLAGFAYVDDTDLVSMRETQEEKVVKSDMQSLLEKWDQGLSITGGGLSHEKSYWYNIEFVQKHSKWKMQGKRDDILIRTEPDGSEGEIVNLDPSQSMKSLGIWIAPDGNMRKEVKYLRQESESWASQLLKSKISGADSWYALKHTIFQKLKYPLLATSISEQESSFIMAPILEAGRRQGQLIVILKAIRSRMWRGKVIDQDLRLQLWKKGVDIGNICENNIEDSIRKAIEDLRKTQADAGRIRQMFLQERARFYADLKQRNEKRIVKQIIATEKSRGIFAKLKYQKNMDEDVKVDCISIEQQDGTTRTIYDKEEMQHEILRNSKKIFRLAMGTLPSTSEFRAGCGKYGEGLKAEKIICGDTSVTKHYENKWQRRYFQQLQTCNCDEEENRMIETKISVEDFQSLMEHTKESTSSSPSGIHMGHYIACEMSESASQVCVGIMNLPFMCGISNSRWENSIHFMIRKVPGNNNIDKLRIIQLIEADFNAYQKIKIGKQLMAHAENNKWLPHGMYGGRKGHTVHDPILIQQLIFYINRQQRNRMLCINMDAQKCYDHIYPNIATIAMRRIGLPKNIGITIAKVLGNMSYKVKTVQGISKEVIKSDGEAWSGVGQGCAAAGPIWLSIQAPMVEIIEQVCHGMHLRACNNEGKYRGCILGFVDDNNINISIGSDCSQQQADKIVSNIVYIWDSMLEATGGALSATKCFYYDLEGRSYKERKDETREKDKEYTTTHLNCKGEKIRLVKVNSNEGRRYLGIRLTPSGKIKEEFEHRLNEAKKYGCVLARSNFTPGETKCYHHNIWLPAIKFALEHTCFNKGECEKIQQKYMPHLINKLGFNRNISKALVYGPERLGGLGLTDLYTQQGICMMDTCIYQLRKGGEIAILLQISIMETQLEYGASQKVFGSPALSFAHVADTWVSCLWKFTAMANITIEYEGKLQEPYPKREGDQIIMDRVLNECCMQDQIKVNLCRCWLRVITIADIVEQDGVTYKKHCLTGKEKCESFLQWPESTRPSEIEWSAWRKCLHYIWGNERGEMWTAMNQWIPGTHHHPHPFLFSPANNKVHKLMNKSNKMYEVYSCNTITKIWRK